MVLGYRGMDVSSENTVRAATRCQDRQRGRGKETERQGKRDINREGKTEQDILSDCQLTGRCKRWDSLFGNQP